MTHNAAPMVDFLETVDRALSAMSAGVGRIVAWLTPVMVLLTFAIVVMRYGFDFGRIYLQELVMYLHAAVFMLAAAWTLQQDGHVRIDVLYQRLPPRRQAWVDLFGTLLLLWPTAAVLFVLSFDYAQKAWVLGEGSRETGGLPLLYLLKSVIPLTSGLLMVQALAEMSRRIRQLMRTRQ